MPVVSMTWAFSSSFRSVRFGAHGFPSSCSDCPPRRRRRTRAGDHVSISTAGVEVDRVGIEGPLQQHAVDRGLDHRGHRRGRDGLAARRPVAGLENAREVLATGLVGLGVESIAPLGLESRRPHRSTRASRCSRCELGELEVGGDVGAQLVRGRFRQPSTRCLMYSAGSRIRTGEDLLDQLALALEVVGDDALADPRLAGDLGQGGPGVAA